MKYIVDFHNDAPDSDIANYLAINGCTVLKEWNNFDKVYLVEAASVPPAAAIVAHVVDDSNSLALKPLDFQISKYHGIFNPEYPTLTIDTADQKDWWKNFTLAKPVFDQPTTQISKKGSHVHVYIMDSGIKADHPEFVDTEISNIYSVTPNDYTDHNGHGTAIASIISGKTCGISSAKLKIVKIFDPNHETLQSEFLSALDAILEDMPENHFAVLNASWAIPRNAWVEFKLKELMDQGVWTIAAAGNSGHAIEDVTPAAMPEAFTVGSYNQDLKPSDFSNYTGESVISFTSGAVNGGILNGWAPGELIYTASLNGSYGYSGGTSMACAIASAVVAYNLDIAVLPSGEIRPDCQGMVIAGPDAAANFYIVQRKDLLDLSDPKYANSVNLIATLIDIPEGTIKCTDEAVSAVRAGEKKNLSMLFDPHGTKSIEVLSGWPSFATILPTGDVWAEPTIADGPEEGQSFKLYEAKVKRVSNDDVEEIVTYDIYVTPSNYKPSDLPEDHVINIVLLSGCSNPPFVSCGFASSSNCGPACPMAGWCCSGDLKTLYCICVNSFGYETVE